MDQTPQNSIQTPITKSEFNKKYWFTSLQMVTVNNPNWAIDKSGGGETSTFISMDYPFMVEMRHYIIRAGKQERFPGSIANVYLDGMSKILAQNDDNLGYMTDPALMKRYYDLLIVDVENLAPEYDAGPAYLKNVTPSSINKPNDERAPWDASQGERATDIVPNAPDPVSQTTSNANPVGSTETKLKSKEINKEFELEGVKYKLTVDKNGKEMTYKDGRLCSAADYFRAASLL